jgi:hypothetical protein
MGKDFYHLMRILASMNIKEGSRRDFRGLLWENMK